MPIGTIPNELTCKCGYEFKISQRVIKRSLTCPKCRRYWLYLRLLDNHHRAICVGRFKSGKEWETRLKQKGRYNAKG